MIVYFVWQCNVGNNFIIVNVAILVYLALLQIVGIILDIQTLKKVKIKVLNDSKYIASLIYISSIVCLAHLSDLYICSARKHNKCSRTVFLWRTHYSNYNYSLSNIHS